MPKQPNIPRLIELHALLTKFQAVERFVWNPETKRRENDVEHSYHLAVTAWFLAPHFKLEADKVIRIALAHDLVEVYSGDTFAYGNKAELDTKDEREHAALERLASEWADFPDLLACIEDYKHKTSEEAKFVYALDKLMPAIFHYMTEGKTWHQHHITLEQFKAEKEKKIPKDSPLYPYYQELLAMLLEKPEYFHREGGAHA